jgi:hypothetical protein
MRLTAVAGTMYSEQSVTLSNSTQKGELTVLPTENTVDVADSYD